MGQAVLRHRIFQRLCDMRLADQVIKCVRPVFARKDFVAHQLTLSRSQSRERSKEVEAASSGVFYWMKRLGSRFYFGPVPTQLNASRAANNTVLLSEG